MELDAILLELHSTCAKVIHSPSKNGEWRGSMARNSDNSKVGPIGIEHQREIILTQELEAQ